MADREKVIKGLKELSGFLFKEYGKAQAEEASLYYDRFLAVDDALNLLKEQEAVEPKQVDLYGKDEWWGLVCVCPDCKAEWMSDKADTHFCPKCGRKVKWE